MRRHLEYTFLFLSLTLSLSTPSTAHTIITTNNPEERQLIKVFDCRDKIYVYVRWEGLKDGAHSLEAFWYNPKHKTQEHTVYKFHAPTEATWVWLELKGGKGSTLFKSFDPEVGYDQFIGPWNVELYLDGKYLTTKPFMVVC